MDTRLLPSENNDEEYKKALRSKKNITRSDMTKIFLHKNDEKFIRYTRYTGATYCVHNSAIILAPVLRSILFRFLLD